jgi:hypothetical protein
MKIHVNAISKDDVTQEFHFKLIEFKLFVHQRCYSCSMKGLNLILSICMGLSFSEVVKGYIGITSEEFLCVIDVGSWHFSYQCSKNLLSH